MFTNSKPKLIYVIIDIMKELYLKFRKPPIAKNIAIGMFLLISLLVLLFISSFNQINFSLHLVSSAAVKSVEVGVAELSPGGPSGGYAIPASGASACVAASSCTYGPNGNCDSSTIICPVAINGSCSAAHYSCSTGNSVSISDGAETWSWTCQGLNGGSDVACSENKPIPPAPTSITATCDTTGNNVTVSYPAAPGATRYAIRLDLASGGSSPHPIQNDNFIGTSFNFATTPGVLYSTWVHSCNNSSGCSLQVASTNFVCPPSLSLTAAPTTIDSGSVSTLSWNVVGATPAPNSCTPTNAWASAGPQPSSNGNHSANVIPPSTSIYSLTCSGPGGNSITRSVTVYTPSGDLKPRGCTILPGGTTCNTYISWNAYNFLGAPRILLGVAPIDNGNYSRVYPPGLEVPVDPDNKTITLDDTGGNFSVVRDAAVDCTQTGPSPEVWTGTFCAPLPIITIDAKPNLVRTGSTSNVEVTVDSNFNLECSYSGGVSYTFNHTASPVPQPYSRSTAPLNSARIVSIKCTSLAWPVITSTKEVRVSVIPVVQEI